LFFRELNRFGITSVIDHDSYLLDLDAEILQAVFAHHGLSAGGGELSDDAYFGSGTRYDSIGAAAMSLTVVYLLLIPAGLMKSFLTWRTGNAWVHVWAYHAISPHVTVDTRLIVSDFGIK
jgi:hypothetical protein